MPGTPFGKNFEPIAQPGEYIYIVEEKKFYRVVAVEPVPQIVVDFGSVAAGASSNKRELKELYLWENFLGQYRLLPIDDFELRLWYPASTRKFATKNAADVVITKWHSDNAQYFSQLTEIFVLADKEKIEAQAYNPTGSTLANTRVRIIGFKYKLEPVEETPEKYVSISLKALTG